MLAVILLVVGMTCGASSSTSDASDWLQAQQDAAGWFPWTPGGSATTNTQGPSGMGILSAYMHTRASGYLLSATDNGDYMLDPMWVSLSIYGDGDPRFATHDPLFMESLSLVSGDSQYADFVQVNFWDMLTAGTYGASDNLDAAGFGAAVVNGRASQGIVELSPWDLSATAIAAHLAGEFASRDALMGAILAGLEATLSAGVYDVTGLAGAVWASAMTGIDLDPTVGMYAGNDSTADLAATLAGLTLTGNDGAWIWNSTLDPTDPGNADTQTTAFAIAALYAFDSATYIGQIARGVAFIRSLQQTDGQFLSWPGAPLNSAGSVEVNAEAISAIVFVAPPTVYVDDDFATLGLGDDPAGPGVAVGYDAYGAVQDGVDEVMFGGAVHVAVGIYTENVDIDKELDLLGQAGAILDGTGIGGTGVNVDSGHVVVDNMEVRDFENGILVYTGSDFVTDWTGLVMSNNTIHSAMGGGGGGTGFGLYIGTESERFMLPTPPWGMVPLTHLLDFTGLEVRGNEIYDTVGAALVLQSITSHAAPLLVVGNNVHDSANDALWIDSSSNILVQGNDFIDSATGIFVSAYSDGWYEGIANQPFDTQDVRILYNIITGNGPYGGVAIYDAFPATIDINYNVITGNSIGVNNWVGGGDVNAILNWWGDVNGPSGAGTGAGDSVSANVIFSPWLGINPDGDAGTVGVQLVSPMLFIVDDIGPAPTLGYLGSAIDASNTLPGIDSIEVRDGTYDASEPITDGVNIFSVVGTVDTILNGDISLDVANIIIGVFRQGFTINGAITVGSSIDASTIHINWNDIYGIVTNAGLKVLDATFNYWDTDGPDTVGRVNVYPYLPIPAAGIIGYMDDYGFNAMQAITFARLLLKGLPAGWLEVAIEIEATFGISIEDAMALIREYGLGSARRALRMASTREDFLVMLMGYAIGGGGGGSYLGGGAGGGTGISIFCVGCSIPLQIELVHPITGEPVTDVCVSYSVCRALPDGTNEIVMFGVMTYDDDLGAYTYEVDTTGLEPGIYDIYIGTDDGRSQHFQIEIAGD